MFLRRRRPAAILAAAGLAFTIAVAPAAIAPPVAAAATEHSIAEIQGSSAESPLSGETVTTAPAVVTAVYDSDPGGFNGFVIQEPGSGGAWDADQPSQAVFVYLDKQSVEVQIGDGVTVTGEVSEYNGLTEITADEVTPVDQELAAPEPVSGVRWEDTVDARENLESMLYATDQTYTVADTYPLYTYGELALGSDGLPIQPTDVGAPGSAAYEEQLAANEASRVNLDDGSNRSFTAEDVDGGAKLPYLTKKQDVRRGDEVTINEPVIIDYRNGSWKFNPTEPYAAGAEIAEIDRSAPPEAPELTGALSIASFNVLNYFTTTGSDGEGCTGSNVDVTGSFNVTWDCDLRGAWDTKDLQRQQDKIVAAINELDPAVAGLMEIENSAKLGEEADEAVATLVGALNAGAHEKNRWAFVPSSDQLPPLDDQDVITNALIYQPGKAKLASDLFADAADAGDDGAFGNARTPIAAAFEPADGGDPVLVSVNHFKSKGSAPDSGPNADQDDGQGAWNAARVEQAQALSAWISDLQEETDIEATALIGDFNSYSQEDPLRALAEAGYSNAAPDDQYSYTFDGLAGSLDHILLNAAAQDRQTESAVWQINSPESMSEEYSTFRTTKINYYDPGPQRSSDHDPVIVGLDAGQPSGADAGQLTLFNINDIHGRIAEEFPNTTQVMGTIVEQRDQAGEDNSLFLSAGDNIGASLFASSIQDDQPTIDVLNATGLTAAAVGNHEFDKGFSDLTGRVTDAADWDYLGANVYEKGTTTPALPEYASFTKAGLEVAVIGAVTRETGSLVSPDGISEIQFGDPVQAVNRVAEQLSDGKPGNGEADVIIAEYHEGAVEGEPSGTLENELSKGGAFAKIVNKTSAQVDAIFTGHTHQTYAWDAPVPGDEDRTRPVLQTGSYGEFIGKVVLEVDPQTDAVTSYTAENLEPTSTPVEELIKTYPAVAEVDQIVQDALTEADELGSVEIGKATAPITRAVIGTDEGQLEDRAGESTVSNMVADMFRDQLADPMRGGAQIGVQNPGGNRADLDEGPITFAEAAGVLPFANTLNTLDLTGEQFKIMLEQQWQVNEDGSECTECSRPYLQLGLSSNVSYTYNESADWGERITSITIDGKPYDPQATYRIGTASFLAAGGDNFWVFADAADKQDSGLIDLDSWTEWVKAESPLSPSYARRASTLSELPSTLTAGETTTVTVGNAERAAGGPNNTLDLSGDAPKNTTLVANLATAADTQAVADGPEVGSATVTDGVATIDIAVPEGIQTGPAILYLTAEPSGTMITVPVELAAGSSSSDPTDQPTDDPTDQPTDDPTDQPTDDPTTTPTDGSSAAPTGGPSVPPSDDDLARTGAHMGVGRLIWFGGLIAAGIGFLIAGRLRASL